MGLVLSTSPPPSTTTAATTSSSPCLTLTAYVKPSTISPTPSSYLKTHPPPYPKIPFSSTTTPSTPTFRTPLPPNPTLLLTLLFPHQYRREQRVFPPLFSLRSARALPLIPSRRTAPYPLPGEPGLPTRPPHRRLRPRDHQIQRCCPHHPRPLISPPLLDVGGGTRGLHGDVLSWIPPTKSPTGGERLRISPLSNRRQPL